MLELPAGSYVPAEGAQCSATRRMSVSSDLDDIEIQSISTEGSGQHPTTPSPAKSKHRKISPKEAKLRPKQLIADKRTSALKTEFQSFPASSEEKWQRDCAQEKKLEGRDSLADLTWDLICDPSDMLSKSDPSLLALTGCSAKQKKEAVLDIKSRMIAIGESIELAKSVLSKLMRPQS